MAENITLGTVSSFANDSSAVAIVNNNSQLIENAFQDVLSRMGTAPNGMNSILDMNNFNIINLPAPATINSPVRLVDVINPGIALTVPPIGTSGSTVPLLNGINTWSGLQTFTGFGTLVQNTADTFWTVFPKASDGFISATEGNTNAIVGALLNNLAPSTSALPAATIGYAKLTTTGNIAFGVYGVTELNATTGVGIAAEFTARNNSGSTGDTSLPPSTGFGSVVPTTIALNVTCGGTNNSSIGINVGPEAGSTNKFNTGIYFEPNSLVQFGVVIGAQSGLTSAFISPGMNINSIGAIGQTGSATIGNAITVTGSSSAATWSFINSTNSRAAQIGLTDGFNFELIAPSAGALIMFSGATNILDFNQTAAGVWTFASPVITVASTTSSTGFNIPSGSAPTSPNNGDIWFDGTNLKIRIGGVTKTFTVS